MCQLTPHLNAAEALSLRSASPKAVRPRIPALHQFHARNTSRASQRVQRDNKSIATLRRRITARIFRPFGSTGPRNCYCDEQTVTTRRKRINAEKLRQYWVYDTENCSNVYQTSQNEEQRKQRRRRPTRLRCSEEVRVSSVATRQRLPWRSCDDWRWFQPGCRDNGGYCQEALALG